jgi:hypothetical protein
MKKVGVFFVISAVVILPLISFASSQPKFDWSGGSGYSQNVVLSKTLPEMSEKAAHDAYVYGLPVEYKTQDGSVALKVVPDYGKSKCNLVHMEVWEDGKLAVNTLKEICDRNYELVAPYFPNLRDHGIK